MAAPRRSWLVFGFSAEEAAGEPSPGPGPRRLEPGPEGIRRVWPAWSYAVLDTGERPPGAAGPGVLPGQPAPRGRPGPHPGPGAPRSPGGR